MYSAKHTTKQHPIKTQSSDKDDPEEWVDDFLFRYREETSKENGYLFNEKMTKFVNTKLRLIETLRNSKKMESTSEQIKQTIESHIDDLLTIIPGGIIDGMVSIENKGDILKKSPYKTLFIDNGSYFIDSNSLADGWFCFVILTSRPWEVRLGERKDGGHTAISIGAAVYYAGEIEFTNGKLISWNNSSGHYTPPENLHKQVQQLTIGHLFPEEKFKDHSE
ncbi:hypothetical protein KVG95_21370 [Pseudomonas sp. SWRI79]|uniref:Uncharacterized protein n=1 Tax=Pseudomonas farris TaxID=2841207 RepID=A0ABS6PZI1_9PSED|nr:hypothetical protein [Pseudomonas farris]MBV4465882.1 hypothetical protein [Pseudomonas farris]